MRYKVDENNYISAVFFNCYIGTCAEYTGTVPTGYTSLEEWASNANIEAYKIVDNNLVYDSVRDAELQAQWAREEESCKPKIPTKTSELINDSEFSTESWVTNEITKAVTGGTVDLSGYAEKTYVDAAIQQIELTPGPQGPKGDKGDSGVQETLLYSSEGSNETITLSDDPKNYNEIEVFYKNNAGTLSTSVKCNPNICSGMTANISLMTEYSSTNFVLYYISARLNLQDNKIVPSNYGQYEIKTNGMSRISTNLIYIYKVVGR